MNFSSEKLEHAFDKLTCLDYITVSFVIFNFLDLLSTILGIFTGKAEETNIIMVGILEDYGILGFTLLKIGVSFLFLLPLLAKKHYKNNFLIKAVTTGLGFTSIVLVPIYVIIVIQNTLILL